MSYQSTLCIKYNIKSIRLACGTWISCFISFVRIFIIWIFGLFSGIWFVSFFFSSPTFVSLMFIQPYSGISQNVELKFKLQFCVHTITGCLIMLCCSTCPLVFGCWELSHVIFTRNGPRLSFWVKIVVILWICPALQAVLSFSAWEKPRDSTPNNRQKLEDI